MTLRTSLGLLVVALSGLGGYLIGWDNLALWLCWLVVAGVLGYAVGEYA